MSETDRPSIKSLSLGEAIRRIGNGSMSQEHSKQLKDQLEKCKQLQIHSHSLIFDSINEQVRLYMEGFTNNPLSIVKDISRAKKLLEFTSDDNANADLPSVIDAIQTNLNSEGELSAVQIMWLILEASGIDTDILVKEMAARGGRAKAGHKSDIRKELECLVNKYKKNSYRDVVGLLNDENTDLSYITIEKSDLSVNKTSVGELKYKDLAGKEKTIKGPAIEKHLKQIRS